MGTKVWPPSQWKMGRSSKMCDFTNIPTDKKLAHKLYIEQQCAKYKVWYPFLTNQQIKMKAEDIWKREKEGLFSKVSSGQKTPPAKTISKVHKKFVPLDVSLSNKRNSSKGILKKDIKLSTDTRHVSFNSNNEIMNESNISSAEGRNASTNRKKSCADRGARLFSIATPTSAESQFDDELKQKNCSWSYRSEKVLQFQTSDKMSKSTIVEAVISKQRKVTNDGVKQEDYDFENASDIEISPTPQNQISDFSYTENKTPKIKDRSKKDKNDIGANNNIKGKMFTTKTTRSHKAKNKAEERKRFFHHKILNTNLRAKINKKKKANGNSRKVFDRNSESEDLDVVCLNRRSVQTPSLMNVFHEKSDSSDNSLIIHSSPMEINADPSDDDDFMCSKQNKTFSVDTKPASQTFVVGDKTTFENVGIFQQSCDVSLTDNNSDNEDIVESLKPSSSKTTSFIPPQERSSKNSKNPSSNLKSRSKGRDSSKNSSRKSNDELDSRISNFEQSVNMILSELTKKDQENFDSEKKHTSLRKGVKNKGSDLKNTSISDCEVTQNNKTFTFRSLSTDNDNSIICNVKKKKRLRKKKDFKSPNFPRAIQTKSLGKNRRNFNFTEANNVTASKSIVNSYSSSDDDLKNEGQDIYRKNKTRHSRQYPNSLKDDNSKKTGENRMNVTGRKLRKVVNNNNVPANSHKNMATKCVSKHAFLDLSSLTESLNSLDSSTRGIASSSLIADRKQTTLPVPNSSDCILSDIDSTNDSNSKYNTLNVSPLVKKTSTDSVASLSPITVSVTGDDTTEADAIKDSRCQSKKFEDANIDSDLSLRSDPPVLSSMEEDSDNDIFLLQDSPSNCNFTAKTSTALKKPNVTTTMKPPKLLKNRKNYGSNKSVPAPVTCLPLGPKQELKMVPFSKNCDSSQLVESIKQDMRNCTKGSIPARNVTFQKSWRHDLMQDNAINIVNKFLHSPHPSIRSFAIEKTENSESGRKKSKTFIKVRAQTNGSVFKEHFATSEITKCTEFSNNSISNLSTSFLQKHETMWDGKPVDHYAKMLDAIISGSSSKEEEEEVPVLVTQTLNDTPYDTKVPFVAQNAIDAQYDKLLSLALGTESSLSIPSKTTRVPSPKVWTISDDESSMDDLTLDSKRTARSSMATGKSLIRPVKMNTDKNMQRRHAFKVSSDDINNDKCKRKKNANQKGKNNKLDYENKMNIDPGKSIEEDRKLPGTPESVGSLLDEIENSLNVLTTRMNTNKALTSTGNNKQTAAGKESKMAKKGMSLTNDEKENITIKEREAENTKNRKEYRNSVVKNKSGSLAAGIVSAKDRNEENVIKTDEKSSPMTFQGKETFIETTKRNRNENKQSRKKSQMLNHNHMAKVNETTKKASDAKSLQTKPIQGENKNNSANDDASRKINCYFSQTKLLPKILVKDKENIQPALFEDKAIRNKTKGNKAPICQNSEREESIIVKNFAEQKEMTPVETMEHFSPFTSLRNSIGNRKRKLLLDDAEFCDLLLMGDSKTEDRCKENLLQQTPKKNGKDEITEGAGLCCKLFFSPEECDIQSEKEKYKDFIVRKQRLKKLTDAAHN